MHKLSVLETTILKKCKNGSQTVGDLLIDLLYTKNKPYNDNFIAIKWGENTKVITMGFNRSKINDLRYLSRNATALYRLLTAIIRLKDPSKVGAITLLPDSTISKRKMVTNLENCTNIKDNNKSSNDFTKKYFLFFPICTNPDLVQFMKQNANSKIVLAKKGNQILDTQKCCSNIQKKGLIQMK